MGCVSSSLLNHEEEDGSTGVGHHIVSLTSTTYGLLNLDPPTPPPPFTLTPTKSPEIINSWELMAGLLDANANANANANDSFRFRLPFPFSPLPPPQPSKRFPIRDLENSNPNLLHTKPPPPSTLDAFQKLSPPPNGENRVVIYTTTLRGIRNTFEACNAVRAAFQGFGVNICERDISMDRGFRDELRELMKGKQEDSDSLPPRVFIKGRYVGGAEEVMRIVEQGNFGELVQGLPKITNRIGGGCACEMCGGIRFLPCFTCNGSCKLFKEEEEKEEELKIVCLKKHPRNVLVVRCSDCNENGLVLCPICT